MSNRREQVKDKRRFFKFTFEMRRAFYFQSECAYELYNDLRCPVDRHAIVFFFPVESGTSSTTMEGWKAWMGREIRSKNVELGVRYNRHLL